MTVIGIAAACDLCAQLDKFMLLSIMISITIRCIFCIDNKENTLYKLEKYN